MCLTTHLCVPPDGRSNLESRTIAKLDATVTCMQVPRDVHTSPRADSWRFWDAFFPQELAMPSQRVILRAGPLVVESHITTRDLGGFDDGDPNNSASERAADDGMAVLEPLTADHSALPVERQVVSARRSDGAR